MSTRSAIFAFDPNDEKLKGVYSHWDGYPEGGVGQAIHTTYNNWPNAAPFAQLKFIDYVKFVILDRVCGWSSFSGWDGNQNHIMSFSQDEQIDFYEKYPKDGSESPFNGYAVYYDEERANSEFMTWDDVIGDSWLEYAYVLRPHGMYTIDLGVKRFNEINIEDINSPIPYKTYEVKNITPSLHGKVVGIWQRAAWFTYWSEPYSVYSGSKPNGFYHPLKIDIEKEFTR